MIKLWQVWTPVEINEAQPRPPARKGHTANLVNGSVMIVFGGSAWVADPNADAECGPEDDTCGPIHPSGFYTSNVADVWGIDLSGCVLTTD